MRILTIGDIHMQTGRLRDIADLSGADLVLIAGDLTHFGGAAEADRVLVAISAHNPTILGVHGNLDRPEVGSLLEQRGLSLHGTARVVDGLGFVGLGGSNLTPFNTPCEYGEKQIEYLLEEGLAALDGHRPFVLLSHPPPAGTTADRLSFGQHVGSAAVRTFIERHQPAYCICGHIHEARGTDLLGSTIIINPGTLQDGGWLEMTYTEGKFVHTLRFLSEHSNWRGHDDKT